jgi:quinol monooxygenase YgiN
MASTLHISYTVKPGDEPKLLEALEPVFKHVTLDPKCSYFNVFISANQPGLVKLVEIWNGDLQQITEVCSPPNSPMLTYPDIIRPGLVSTI